MYYTLKAMEKTTAYSKEDKNALIAEFHELREEIRVHLQRRGQSLSFIFAITVAVLGLDASTLELSGVYWIFFVASALVASMWVDEIRRIKAIFRAGAYIEVFIEPRFATMRWETYGRDDHIQTSLVERAIANGAFPGLALLHAILGAARLSGVVGSLGYLVLVPIVLVTGYILLRAYQEVRRGRDEATQFWRRKAEEARSSSEAVSQEEV